MPIAETVVYVVVFGVAFVFSIFAIVRKTPILCALSWVTWYALALAHLGVQPSGVFANMPAVLYFGFGTLFLIYTVYTTIKTVHDAIILKVEKENDVSTV
jgi:hypothetical protein